jgi:hypothetical protein
MRFPAGLRARLLQREVLHGFRREASSAIFHLSPLVQHFPASLPTESFTPETEWHSAKACTQAALQARAAVVWLGGTEPLFHPAIGEVSAALVDAGFYVFLHTSGMGLRKRIHEFKPVDRLYLTLEIPVPAAAPEGRNPLGQSVPLQTVLEGIRVARLSGFHVCAHFTVGETTFAANIAALLDAPLPQHLDGITASSVGASLTRARHSSFARTLADAVGLIPSSGWRSFSRLLEASNQHVADATVAPVAAVLDQRTSSAEALEETA